MASSPRVLPGPPINERGRWGWIALRSPGLLLMWKSRGSSWKESSLICRSLVPTREKNISKIHHHRASRGQRSLPFLSIFLSIVPSPFVPFAPASRMRVLVSLQILIGFSILATAIPKQVIPDGEHRVLNKDAGGKDHYVHSQHNSAYDHEAFLGEEAKTFDQLTPEESTRRLGIIVDKIDKDRDGYVTQEELKDWIMYTQQRYIRDNVERQWSSHNPMGKEKLSWKEYKDMVYGDLEEQEAEKQEGGKTDDSFSYLQMFKRDRRRWTTADLDGDDALTKEEFTAFLHAEDAEHMKDVIVLETMEDIDKDEDGKISLAEYIGDIYNGEEGEEEPEWVKNEKEQFSLYRDKDGDGFLNPDEVKTWIIPAEFDHAEAESRHLIYEADTDADHKLTKSEILEKYDIFVGSQATDFGEALTRHDEF